MKRQIEGPYAVLAHRLQRHRAFAVPRNAILARFQRLAEFVDHVFGCAFETEDRPTAEIERRHVFGQTTEFLTCDHCALEPVSFERFELRLVDGEETHAERERAIGEHRQRLIPERVYL